MSANNFYQVGQEESGDNFNSAMTEAPRSGNTMSITVNTDGNKTQSYNGATNTSSSNQTTSVNTAEGVTITSSSGSPRAYASRGDDLVLYHGMTVEARTLEGMGVMTLNPVTNRYDMNEAQPQAQSQQQSNETETGDVHDQFHMSESDNAEVNSCIPESLTTQPAVMQAITNRAVESLVSGDLSSTIRSFSQSSGQTPSEAAVSVGKAMAQFQTASDKYLGKTVGMPSSDIPLFYDWIKTNAPGELKSAANSIVSKNNFREMGKLAGVFYANNPPSINALVNAGYKVGKSSSGNPTVFIQGREMSVKAAAKARLI